MEGWKDAQKRVRDESQERRAALTCSPDLRCVVHAQAAKGGLGPRGVGRADRSGA